MNRRVVRRIGRSLVSSIAFGLVITFLAIASGCSSTDGTTSRSGGNSPIGGQTSVASSITSGGTTASTGGTSIGNTSVVPPLGGTGGGTASSVPAEDYVVAVVQSPKSSAIELEASDVDELVESAVRQAGGLDFIHEGQTVVLKPSLVTLYEDAGMLSLSPTANGVATDWRVVKAVADLVRVKNSTGKILVMEGSTLPTPLVYSVLGYTSDNFGTSADEFVALEGDSCADPSLNNLEERAAPSGEKYWVNTRFVTADWIISIPVLVTHAWSGVGGAVESIGVGATPASKYASGENSVDCTRTNIDRSSPETLGEFISDFYAIRPADFVVMDGLQGLEHGPVPAWDDSGTFDYAPSTKNMRLILAGKNAVALDSVAASIMKCNPAKVPHLAKLADARFGTTELSKITVVGKPISDVAVPFASKFTDICPGI